MHKCLQPYSHMHTYTYMNTFTSTMHTTDIHTCTSIPTHLYINQHYKHDTHTRIPHRYACIHTEKCTAWYFSLELDLFVLYMVWSQSYFKVGSKRLRDMYWLTLFFSCLSSFILSRAFIGKTCCILSKTFLYLLQGSCDFFLRVHF